MPTHIGPSIAPNGRATLLSILALSLACMLAPAQAQFSGNLDNDLTKLSDPSRGADSASANTTPAMPDDVRSPGRLRADEASRGVARRAQPEALDLIDRPPPYVPSEFERFVQSQGGNANGKPIRRFGAELLTDTGLASPAQDPLPVVPGNYVVRPGDEIAVTIWGSVDADLRLVVDRAGRIAIPRVGSINVGGLHNADLADVIHRQVSLVYTNFQLTVTLGQVRPIRIFLSGYAQRRGSITVSGLSSVLHALMRAGGPSAAGSFRDIHVLRGGRDIATFDLYDLLLKGKRDSDLLVQPDDVIFVGPVGPQVALLGSVNEPAVYELKSNETLSDVIHMAGGFADVADSGRVAIERLADRIAGHVTELKLPEHASDKLAGGDIVRVFSVVSATLPKQYQNERVRIEGEVAHPGDYILPPGSHLADAIRVAGGLTASAYVYGADFRRESVRVAQQANYDRALRDLETKLVQGQVDQGAISAEEVADRKASTAADQQLLSRLRTIKPTGRIVLEIEPTATQLPDLALEDGDTLTIPDRGTSVGVFGSVFSSGNFLYHPDRSTYDYLRLAGGTTRGADDESIFMIRANGSVVSARQGASFWHSGTDLRDAVILPGDTIFVPEELNKGRFVKSAKDWTQILYQFGLGLAGIKSLGL